MEKTRGQKSCATVPLITLYRRKIRKLAFMHLPQSQNKNVNNMCIVGNPVHMISEQGGVKSQPELMVCLVDRLFPNHLTGICLRTDSPPLLPGWWHI